MTGMPEGLRRVADAPVDDAALVDELRDAMGKIAAIDPRLLKAAADHAPGLPDRSAYGDLGALGPGQLLSYVVQKHQADRAGLHHDIRFGDQDKGLLSWAARKGVPEPGQKHLAVQQPVHGHDYRDFEGEIPEGYGKGTVSTHDKGQVLITKTTPESVHFTTAHGRYPERFTLARPKGWDRNWLLMNTTPRDPAGHEKLHYKSIPPGQVEPAIKAMQEGDTAEAKVDGASQLVRLAKDHAEMLSYRTSKMTGRPLFHSERFFGGRPEVKVPPHLEGSVLKGETYAHRDGKVGTPQDVGMLLNSGVARSLQLQREKGLGLKNMLYDIQQYGRTPVGPDTPRDERRKMMEEIVGHLPADRFHLSEEHKGPEAATRLWDMVRSGQHPLTGEGIIIHPRTGVPSKAKLMEDHDVHLRGTFPGEGRRQSTIGGFTYSHTPEGPIAGKVGTGFSDDFLGEAARDPSAYIGRVARLQAQQKLPSGALRGPSFIGLHEDKTAWFLGSDDTPPDPGLIVPDPPMAIRRRRRRGLPALLPQSWMPGLKRTLWGGPDAILPQVIERAEGQPVEKEAEAHPALADLKRAKAESDRGNYAAKGRILSDLLDRHPGEFVQDSTRGTIVGLTHEPTSFKIHAPRGIVRGRAKAAAFEENDHDGDPVPAGVVGPVAPGGGATKAAGSQTSGVLGSSGCRAAAQRADPPDLHHPVPEVWGQAGLHGAHDRHDRGVRPGQPVGVLQPAHVPGLREPLQADLRGGDPKAAAARDDAESRVRRLIKGIPEADLYGAWYNAAERKARVSMGDWSETDSRPIEAALKAVLGEGNVEVEAEIGPPMGPDRKGLADGWVKLGKANIATMPDGRVIDIGRLIAIAAGRRVEKIPIDDVARPSKAKATGYSKKRQAKVDMDKPVVVGKDGTLYDGRHRLFRHFEEDKSHIRAVRVSDRDVDAATLCEDDCKPRGDRIDANRIEMLPAKAAMANSASPAGVGDAACRRPAARTPECGSGDAGSTPVGMPDSTKAAAWGHRAFGPLLTDDELRELAATGPEKVADLLPWVNMQSQQQRVKKRIGAGENLLVYHGLGSGKSLAGIAAAEGVGGPYTAIVPASLRPNYEKEIAKFTDRTSPSEVLSYTGVGMGKQPQQSPNTVILDEAQRIRNPSSAGSRAAMDMAMRAPHRVLLSGTPIVNDPSDLAVPLSILSGKEMSPASFNKRFVGSKTVSPGLMGWFRGVQPTKVPTLQNEDDLEKMLEGHVDYQASRTPEGVKTKDERVEVDLSPEQQDFYKLMWGKMPWMMRWKLSNDYPLSKDELAHLSSFMTGPRQAALSLYPFHSSKDPMKAFQTSSKLQSAMKSLQETLGKDPRAKALVYSNFIDAGLTPYAAALKANGIPYGQFHGTMTEEDRKRALDDYNTGKSRVLLLGPAAAEGISARGTQLIQLMDPHWNEARLGQARGRGLRFDSHEGLPEELRNVRIQRFVSKMPPPGWLGRMFGAEARPSADEILEQQSQRKEELNEQFREVLRRVGSPGYQRPWSLFG